MPARCDPTTDWNVCVRSMAYLASSGRGNLISSSGWWNECVSHSLKMWFGGAFWESLFWIHFKAIITFVVIQSSGTDSFVDTSFCSTCKMRAQKETYHPKCRIFIYFRFARFDRNKKSNLTKTDQMLRRIYAFDAQRENKKRQSQLFILIFT